MDFHAQHIEFVLAAYAISLVVLTGLVAWIVVRASKLESRLGELENAGAPRRRRADKPPAAGPDAS